MDTVFVVLLCFAVLISQSVGGSPLMELDDMIYVKDNINVIEGSRVKLNCTSDVKGATFKWTAQSSRSFIRHDSVLAVDSVHREFAGVYTCIMTTGTLAPVEDALNISVNVLYSPIQPTISGPMRTVFEDQLTLSCHSDANPSPSYWWSWSGEPRGKVIGRGDRYTETVLSTNDWVLTFCWAENTMIPTLGKTVTSSVAQQHKTTVHRKVLIWELFNEYTFLAGSTLDVWCRHTGYPYAETWWTKKDESDLEYYDQRLVIQNVQFADAGYYTCHCENNITLSNGTKQMTTVSRSTLIKIEAPTMPAECVKFCPLSGNTTFTITERSNTTGGCGHCPETSPSGTGSDNGLIVAAALGWFLALVLVVVGLVYWIRQRRTTKKDDDIPTPSDALRHLYTMPQYDRKPTLPKRPERPEPNSKNRNTSKSEHIYLDLQPVEGEPVSPNYDYAQNSDTAGDIVASTNRKESGSDDPSVSGRRADKDSHLILDDGYLEMDGSCKKLDTPLTQSIDDEAQGTTTEGLADDLGYEVPLGTTPDHQPYENTMVTATSDNI